MNVNHIYMLLELKPQNTNITLTSYDNLKYHILAYDGGYRIV